MARLPYVPTAFRQRKPVQVGEIKAGWFLTKLARGGVDVPVHIWHGPPLDPATFEPLDRAPRWQMRLNGSYTDARGEPWDEGDILRTYLFAVKRPIDEREYNYRLAVQQHAIEHDSGPETTPGKPINWNKILPF